VVGESNVTSEGIRGPGHAFLWQNGVMTDLGAFGQVNSEAEAINDAGQVVGSFFSEAISGPPAMQRAFLYADGKMTDLGTLPGYDRSYAHDINNAGQVVGLSYTLRSGSGALTVDSRAFLYSGGTMTDLNSLLPPGSGWLLETG